MTLIRIYKKGNKINVHNQKMMSFDTEHYQVIFGTPIKVFLHISRADFLKVIIWFLITLGKLKVFCVMDGAKVIHYSFILPRNFRFPFMSEGDLEIGPCYTNPEYRNQGIYTKALKLIPILYKDRSLTFWIYTTEANLPSRRAIEKAGYSFQGYFTNKGFFRILCPIENTQDE